MMRLGLVVSGRMEKLALGDSIRRAFPEAQIELAPAQLTDAFTTGRLSGEPALVSPKGTPSAVMKMAVALIALVDPGRRGDPVDMAIAADDLELANREQPALAVGWFARAVQRRLADLEHEHSAAKAARVRAVVRERCSFHLLCPMTEAYFFGDPDAVRRAGAARPARVACTDWEDFRTDDADYSAAGGDTRHPKGYLSFLANGAYRETRGGVSALRELAWARVLGSAEATRFARSLLDDVADACGTERLSGALHPLTQRRDGGVLRNL